MKEIGIQLDIPQDVLVQMLGVGIRKQVKYDNDRFIRDFVKDKNTIYTKVNMYEEDEEEEEKSADKKRVVSADSIPSLNLANRAEIEKKLGQETDLLVEIMEQRRKSQVLSTNVYTISDADEEIEIDAVEAECYGDEIEYDDEDLDLADNLKLISKEEIDEYEKGLKEEDESEENDYVEYGEEAESEEDDYIEDNEENDYIEDSEEIDKEDDIANIFEEKEEKEIGVDIADIFGDKEEIKSVEECNKDERRKAIRDKKTDKGRKDIEKEEIARGRKDREREEIARDRKDKDRERGEIKKPSIVKQVEKSDKVEKSSESCENSDVTFIKGMSLVEFLRNNPKIREIKSVLKWFTKEQIQEALDNDEVLAKKGKFIL